jgi:large subunit ribosomal protein L29
MMSTKELRTLTEADLAGRLDESYQELFNLRFQKSTGKLKNTARVREVKQQIARIKTILHERELAVAGE